MSFRDNLQHLRATRNMTQEQLAMLLGVSRQSVTKWEVVATSDGVPLMSGKIKVAVEREGDTGEVVLVIYELGEACQLLSGGDGVADLGIA